MHKFLKRKTNTENVKISRKFNTVILVIPTNIQAYLIHTGCFDFLGINVRSIKMNQIAVYLDN